MFSKPSLISIQKETEKTTATKIKNISLSSRQYEIRKSVDRKAIAETKYGLSPG